MFITIFLLICIAWLWKCQQRSDPNEPPSLSGCYPVIGHVHRIIGNSKDLWNLVKNVSDELKKTDGVICIKLGYMTVYVVADPEDCLTVSNACLQKDAFYDFAKPWLGEGLLTGSVPVWKVHRKLLGPAFRQVVLDGFLGILNKQALRLADDLALEVGREPFDFGKYVRSNSLQTICMTAMGVDYADISSLKNKYVCAMEQLLNIFITRFQHFWLYHPTMFNLSAWKSKHDLCVNNLHNISSTILGIRKAEFLKNKDTEMSYGKQSGTKFKPFMDLLLELSIVKEELNDQEIREEVDTMMAAGHETIATALTFTMILIGSYPEVQDRIYKELRDVFGDDGRDVSKEDLSQLVYIEAVLKESMRLYSVIPFVSRRLDKDVKIRNYTLSSGRSCFLFLYGINHHPMWGPDVEDFNPDRWLDSAASPHNATAFGSFSFGRRMCIGKAYAYMSMKITLVQIMRRYIIKGDHTKMKLKLDFVLKPISGHYITIARRNTED